MARKPKAKRRSECPVSISLEMFGDKWSLLVVRDLMVRGFRTFKEFQRSGEGIASNILADRLEKLQASGMISAEAEPGDARRVNYRLTEKGIDLAPLMLDLLIWGAKHEQTGHRAPRSRKWLKIASRCWQKRGGGGGNGIGPRCCRLGLAPVAIPDGAADGSGKAKDDCQRGAGICQGVKNGGQHNSARFVDNGRACSAR